MILYNIDYRIIDLHLYNVIFVVYLTIQIYLTCKLRHYLFLYSADWVHNNIYKPLKKIEHL